jgi:TRAP-type C4-dicarboxylate transport system permease small subunit
MNRIIDRIDDAWAVAERWMLVALLLAMIALAFSQVVLRNMLSTGIGWADVAVRHLMLWVGLLGASVAAKENRHLSVDVASRLLPPKGVHALEAVLGLVTAGVCGLLFWASLLFMRSLYEFGTGTIEGLPAALAGMILPLAFAGLALRFLFRTGREIAALAEKMRGD